MMIIIYIVLMISIVMLVKTAISVGEKRMFEKYKKKKKQYISEYEALGYDEEEAEIKASEKCRVEILKEIGYRETE